MGLVNIVLWVAGVVLIAVGYIRNQVPSSRYHPPPGTDANKAPNHP